MLRFYFWVLKGPQLHKKILSPPDLPFWRYKGWKFQLSHLFPKNWAVRSPPYFAQSIINTPVDWQVSQNCYQSASEAVADKSLRHRSTSSDQVSDTRSSPVTRTFIAVSAAQTHKYHCSRYFYALSTLKIYLHCRVKANIQKRYITLFQQSYNRQ